LSYHFAQGCKYGRYGSEYISEVSYGGAIVIICRGNVKNIAAAILKCDGVSFRGGDVMNFNGFEIALVRFGWIKTNSTY